MNIFLLILILVCCTFVCGRSVVSDSETPWTVALQAPLSITWILTTTLDSDMWASG